MSIKRLVVLLMVVCLSVSLVACGIDYTTGTVNSKYAKYFLNQDHSSYSVTGGCDLCTYACDGCECHETIGTEGGKYCSKCSEKCVFICECECHDDPNGTSCDNCSEKCVPKHFDIVIDRYKKWPVTKIYDKYLQNCNHVKHATFKDSVDVIGQNVLNNCDSLESLVIGNVSSIGAGAFADCDALVSVVLGKVTRIGADAFSSCDSLREVYFVGDENDWLDAGEAFEILNNREVLLIDEYVYSTLSRRIYYYSASEPTESGRYWHYVDGVPTKW